MSPVLPCECSPGFCPGSKIYYRPKLTAMALSTLVMVVSSSLPMRSRRRDLSMVRTCSSSITLSRESPTLWALSSICVGRRALPVWLVIAAAMTVGAVLIAGVVLDDEHRAHAALLRADDGA